MMKRNAKTIIKNLLHEAGEGFAREWRKLDAIPPFEIEKYPITSAYGWRIHPITRKLQWHTGIDIAVPCGTPVYSPFDGKVIDVSNQVGGNQVIIRNDKIGVGISHLSSIVKVGKVKKGELIAFTGKSGRATGCHVHMTLYYYPLKEPLKHALEVLFGARQNGQIDPILTFKKLGIPLSGKLNACLCPRSEAARKLV